jgi:hypothetical protein
VESTTGSVDGSPASRAAPLPPDDGAAMDVDKSMDGEGKDGKETRDTHAPAKKYKMTEAMKGLIWNLVCLSNECCRIENEKKYVRGGDMVALLSPMLTFRTYSLARWKVRHRW